MNGSLGILFLLINSFWLIESAKVLFLVPVATRSEKHFYEPLIFGLAKDGHIVTVVTSCISEESHPNVTEIMPSTYQEQFGGFASVRQRYAQLVFRFLDYDLLAGFCHKVFQNEEFQEVIGKEYDLVFTHVFYGSCFYGVLHKIGAPFILFDSFPVPSYLLEDLGSHMPNSFVPYSLYTFSSDMSYAERVGNFLINWIMYVQDKLIVSPMMEKVYRKYLGKDVPAVTDIHKNASLFFMNSHYTSTYHRPLLPDVIEIGGIHCRPSKPLPKDLEDFVSNSPDGFIFFSLGTLLHGMTVPDSVRLKIVSVFSRLKQRVVWKWENEQMDGLPSNVMLKKWLPQQDLLGHPNIRLFISHGGLLSTQQIIYNGVPALFFPVFFDQVTNTKNAVNNGFALTLDLHEFTEEEFETAITRLIYEPQFRGNASRISKLFRDQPDTPLSRAVYWSNYVINHKGAQQLHSPARKLNILQMHSVDVLLGLLVVTGLLTFIVLIICSKCMSTCFPNGNSKGRVKPKKQ